MTPHIAESSAELDSAAPNVDSTLAPQSWTDRLVRLPERLPGPSWAAVEKTRLLGAVNARVKATLDQQHHAVDTEDHASLGNLQQQMATLVSQRELIDALPTWPWSQGTMRGIASALALPIAIFIITRMLEKVV
jgi:hypothetical protein